MSQYKVPQDVEAEDKIIGPLTLRQFIYAVIGVAWAGLIFSIFKSVPPLMVLLAFPPTLVMMLLAFYKRDGQDFEHYLVALVGYFGQTRRRLWIKEPVVEAFKLTAPPVVSTQSQRNPAEVRSQLEQLATVMDSHGAHDQLDAMEDDRLFMPEQPVAQSGGLATDKPEIDILDPEQNPQVQNVSDLIEKSVQNLRSEALQQMQAEASGQAATSAEPAASQHTKVDSHPKPSSARIEPQPPTVSEMTAPVSDDIIRLATESDDLKVSQIAAQANRVTPLAEGESVKL